MKSSTDNPPGAQTPPLDVLVATLLYLMTRFSTTGCAVLRDAVIQHLALLHDHPSTLNSQPIRNTTEQLAREWLDLQGSPAPANAPCRSTPTTFH